MTERKAPFATVEEAVEEIRQGRMIVLVDDEDRENEGDLTMAADSITPEAINFMTKFGRGLICLSLTEQRCDALDLRQISPATRQPSAPHSASPSTPSAGRRRELARRIALLRFWLRRIRIRGRRIWRGLGTFTLCGRGMAACWCGLGRPRLAWIWRGLRGAIIQA